jgi:hypothetical protein
MTLTYALGYKSNMLPTTVFLQEINYDNNDDNNDTLPVRRLDVHRDDLMIPR